MGAGTKLQLSDELYGLFRDLLYNRVGLNYPEHRRDDLAHGLGQALSGSDFASLDDLYRDALNYGAGWERLLVHLTVGETRFFRNEAQFHALRQHILPELFQRRGSMRTLRIWSAGCATGEEPYSIAMLLTDVLPNYDQWSVSILGTDINPHFLERAREGLYSAWSFRETDESLRERFFTPEGTRWRLNPAIRRMVTFQRLNLVESSFPSLTNGTLALDLIVCRNVTIYFDTVTTRRIAEQFYAALTPGGWLVVGHSEPQASTYHQFETHNFPNAIFYRKALDAPLFPLSSPGTASSKPSAAAPAKQPAMRQVPPLTPPATRQRDATPLASGKREQQPAARQARNASPLHPMPLPPATATRQTQPAANAAANAAANDVWSGIMTCLAQGKKRDAELLLASLLHDNPGHLGALVTLARLYADRGDWAAAQRLCEQALTIQPLSMEASYLLAQIHEHEDQLDDAIAAYRRVIYIDRTFIPGLLGMAHVWRRLHRLSEARRTYRNLQRHLATLPASSVLHDVDDVTVQELMEFVNRQLVALSEMSG